MRHARDRRLQHGRMLHQSTLHFKRTNAVAGRFNDIVAAADIPKISVLVLPRNVACVVKSIVPYFMRQLVIFIITEEHSDRNLFICTDNDLARLARRA
ncbi:hypothetical protein SDC9_212411 [bioreactor metagenome]|uniref:Uncharacterized protein n=1 Tax=bioreactor metagenome TaxID=1076179 RepID=A0A645JLU7_9ZZZZ